MGYSIMAPFQTNADKEKMEEFLKKHFRSLREITKDLKLRDFNPDEDYPPHDDMSYGPDTTVPILGFNYGAGTFDEERDYYFLLCYWMAIHGGKRRVSGKHKEKPYIIYDGVETWTLFVDEPADKSVDWVEVDTHGYRKMSKLREHEHFPKAFQLVFNKHIKQLEKIDHAIHEELIRLSCEWFKENS